jgi:hypothetical protein
LMIVFIDSYYPPPLFFGTGGQDILAFSFK